MRTTLCLACGVLVLATMGAAQTPMKLVGRMQCAKPDPNYAVPVSDGANHAMSLSAVKCTWSDGAIAGDRLKDEEDTFVSDATGTLPVTEATASAAWSMVTSTSFASQGRPPLRTMRPWVPPAPGDSLEGRASLRGSRGRVCAKGLSRQTGQRPGISTASTSSQCQARANSARPRPNRPRQRRFRSPAPPNTAMKLPRAMGAE